MKEIFSFDSTPANENPPPPRERFEAVEAEYRLVVAKVPRGLEAARRALAAVEEAEKSKDGSLDVKKDRLDSLLDAWENTIAIRIAENFLSKAGMHIEAGALAIAAEDKARVGVHLEALYEQCTSPDPDQRENLPVARTLWRQLICLAYHAGVPDKIREVQKWALEWEDVQTFAVSIVALHERKEASAKIMRLWQTFAADTEGRMFAREELIAALIIAYAFPRLAYSEEVKKRGERIMRYSADAPMIMNPLDPLAYLPTGEPRPEPLDLTSREERARRERIRSIIKEVRERAERDSEHWNERLQESFVASSGLKLLHLAYPIAAKTRR